MRLLKVDTEGHECDVLDGAQDLLLRNSPVVVIEVSKHQGRVLAKLRDIVSRSTHRYRSFVADCDGFLQPVSLEDRKVTANDLILVPDWADVRVD